MKKLKEKIRIGELNIAAKFLFKNGRELPKPKQKAREDIPIIAAAPLQINKPIFLQLYVYISKGLSISRRHDYPQLERNVFVRYKIPGTGDAFSTEVRFKNRNPSFQHSMIMPLSVESMKLLLHQGFIFEIWDRREDKTDDLIGLSRVQLDKLRQSCYDAESGELKLEWVRTSVYPITLVDESLAVVNLGKGGKEGFIEVILAVGTPT